jgi:hypothetical protein
MTEPERAEQFREAIAKMPARSFKPNKRQAAGGLSVILALTLGMLRLATYESRTHHVDNTAYLECIAQAQTADTDATNLGFPGADPSFGVPGTATAPVSTGQALNDAVIACSKYPH